MRIKESPEAYKARLQEMRAVFETEVLRPMFESWLVHSEIVVAPDGKVIDLNRVHFCWSDNPIDPAVEPCE